MSDNITLTGTIATDPEMVLGSTGTARLTFRLASQQRKYDKQQSAWVDTGTNWYTVTCFRRLAENANESLGKGDRVIVTGRLSINEWEKNGRNGTTIEIVAETIGHDLFWGTTTFRKPAPAAKQNDPWDASNNYADAPF